MSSLLFGNGTNIVHWQPSPQTRGTYDILTTCLITLILCVWTAVHLNIPEPEHPARYFRRKVGWLILALLAPELIAYTAWWQRRQAKRIVKLVNESLGHETKTHSSLAGFKRFLSKVSSTTLWLFKSIEGLFRKKKTEEETVEIHELPDLENQSNGSNNSASSDPEVKRQKCWTLRHGFFAIMGGWLIEVPADLPADQKFLPGKQANLRCLTYHSIEMLAELHAMEELPELAEEEIKVRSNANGMGKIIVVIQAVWFIAQCVSRLIGQVPISLLELNTAAHALCALAIYFLWWEKPFEVESAVAVRSPFLWQFLAFDWMKNNRGVSSSLEETILSNPHKDLGPRRDRSGGIEAGKGVIDLENEYDIFQRVYMSFEDENYINPSERSGLYNLLDDSNNIIVHEANQTLLKPWLVPRSFIFHLPIDRISLNIHSVNTVLSQASRAFGQRLIMMALPQGLKYRRIRSKSEYAYAVIDQTDANRWVMAWKWQNLIRSTARYSEIELRSRASDLPEFGQLTALSIGLGFCAVTVIYGGLHCLAWNAHFMSKVEQFFWRCSAPVVAGGAVAMLISLHLGALLQATEQKIRTLSFDEDEDEDRITRPSRTRKLLAKSTKIAAISLTHIMVNIIVALSAIPVILVPFAYCVARGYLVVESFIQLFNLPAGVFQTPNWSPYFPHIS